MPNNLTAIHTAVMSALDAAMPQPIVDQAVPDTETVVRNSAGAINPYIAIQFGDLQEGYRHNMASVRYDDYYMPIYLQVIAPTPAITRAIYNKMIDTMLGLTTQWTGNIRKRPGGGMWPLVTSNGATEAYLFPCSFSLLIQFE